MASKKNEKSPFPISIGDSSDIVKDIQERLALLGSKVKATGKFTIGMLSAVKCWQKKNKLKVTGNISAFQYEKLVTMTDPLKKPVGKRRVVRRVKP